MEKDSKYTKYEKARIIGARALQISMGAPLLVKLSTKQLEELKYNPIEIAKIEFEKQVIPMSVKKSFPEPRAEEQKKKTASPKEETALDEEETEPEKTKKGKKQGKKNDEDDEEI
jgi:DNA-directed RNA polymerase subunit K